MNKAKTQNPDIAPEYRFGTSKGRRGAFAEQAKNGMRYEIVSDAEDHARREKRTEIERNDKPPTKR